METLIIRTDKHESKILLGEKIAHFRQYLPPSKVFVVSDARVMSHYGDLFRDFPQIILRQGEPNKTFQAIEQIIGSLIHGGADRSSFLLGIGGGIVTDIAGFAASVYMRGIPFGFISTTLLSQVDASVGGKNGVNFEGYKNIAGTFNQPDFVICDPGVLKTLDQRDYLGGFAEIIKAAAIRDAAFFDMLSLQGEALRHRDEEMLSQAIRQAVKIKASVVEQDEREKGERRVLNFGHTFAHALEKETGMPHGEAVSIGMVLASGLSVRLGLMKPGEDRKMIDILSQFGLPVVSPLPASVLADAMTHDKKREQSALHLVLLEQIGKAVTHTVQTENLKALLHDLC